MITVVELIALTFLQFHLPGIEGLRYDRPSRYRPTYLDVPKTTLYNQEQKSPMRLKDLSRNIQFY